MVHGREEDSEEDQSGSDLKHLSTSKSTFAAWGLPFSLLRTPEPYCRLWATVGTGLHVFHFCYLELFSLSRVKAETSTIF